MFLSPHCQKMGRGLKLWAERGLTESVVVDLWGCLLVLTSSVLQVSEQSAVEQTVRVARLSPIPVRRERLRPLRHRLRTDLAGSWDPRASEEFLLKTESRQRRHRIKQCWLFLSTEVRPAGGSWPLTFQLESDGGLRPTTWPALTPPASLGFPVRPRAQAPPGVGTARTGTRGMASSVKVGEFYNETSRKSSCRNPTGQNL